MTIAAPSAAPAEPRGRAYEGRYRRTAERHGPAPAGDAERTARALGWFSIGLGLAEVVAPRDVGRFIGVGRDDRSRNVIRAMGVREITSGLGVLARPTSAGWLWTRVGGDALDLALLGSALRRDGADRRRTAAAALAVAGVAALDVATGRELSARAAGEARERGSIQTVATVTVNRPVEEVYGFWRDFANLPRFMSHLESVETTGERRSRWRATAPAGTRVEWEAELVDDRPNERIAWRSLEGATVPNRGEVRFRRAPADQGTEVTVDLRYEPPAGRLGATVARLFGEEPGQQIRSDLRRFKQVLETGEVVRSDASIHRGPHPARPPEHWDRPATGLPGGAP